MRYLTLSVATIALMAAWSCHSTEPSPPVPTLLAPTAGMALDNACAKARNRIRWDFDWSDVPGAEAYHLQVTRAGALWIDEAALAASSFRYEPAGASHITEDGRTGWRWKVRASVGGTWGAWSADQAFDIEAADTDCPPPPSLVEPRENAVMDNGCFNSPDLLTWDFDWSDVGADTRYELFVMSRTASIPAVSASGLTASSYRQESRGAFIQSSFQDGWFWRVRALVDDTWTEWSNERHFSVEAPDTDCR